MPDKLMLIDYARTVVTFEIREQERGGGRREDARGRIADHSKISQGTLFNIVKRRVNRIKPRVLERIFAYAIKDTEAEIANIEKTIARAREVGLAPFEIRRLELRLEGERQLLRELRGE